MNKSHGKASDPIITLLRCSHNHWCCSFAKYILTSNGIIPYSHTDAHIQTPIWKLYGGGGYIYVFIKLQFKEMTFLKMQVNVAVRVAALCAFPGWERHCNLLCQGVTPNVNPTIKNYVVSESRMESRMECITSEFLTFNVIRFYSSPFLLTHSKNVQRQ